MNTKTVCNLPYKIYLLKRGIWKRLKGDETTYFMISPFFLDYFETGKDPKQWFGKEYALENDQLVYESSDEFKENQCKSKKSNKI